MAAVGFDHVITRKVAVGSGSVGGSVTKNAGARVSLDVDVANAVTNGEHILPINVSQVKSFFIVSDKDVLIETNDGTTPDDTLTLLAGIPYEWYEGSAATFELGTDVTSIFITNASGATARIQLEFIYDPTP
jgi:hypothetical protein